MNFEFTENTVINIPLIYKGYRLEGDEKVRFRCLFKTADGDFPYILDMEEDNKGEDGGDGKYTVTLDMGRYGISPGRYDFDLSLVLESGSLVTIAAKNDNHIDVISASAGLSRANGEVFFGADFIVEQGKSDGWNYKKWHSGLIECWGTVSFELGKATYTLANNIRCTAGYIYPPSGLVVSLSHVMTVPIHYQQIGSSCSVTTDTNDRLCIACNIYSPTAKYDDLVAKDVVDVHFNARGNWK